MVVESPEVLDGVEGDDGPLVVLPAAGAVVLEEPEGPSVLGKNDIDRKELHSEINVRPKRKLLV